MNSEQPNRVSVIDPISPAIERARTILFRPFNLGKWFTIGFCAWLAYLGSGGGRGGNGGAQWHEPHKPYEQNAQSQIAESINAAKEYLLDNLFWIIPVTVIVVILAIVIGLLITWLNSRGRFMFLHCVAENKSEIKVPWHKFSRHGNSLFLFRIVLGLIGLAIVAVPILAAILLAIMMATRIVPSIASVPVIILCVLIILVLAIALFLVKKFTFDFVVPIMFLRTESCIAGWREFLTILSANKWSFTLYILFQIVIAIVIGTIIAVGFCIGCCFCCASLLLLIPYIGTVILLPLLVFDRAYSLYYLRQFGPGFDVFSP
jgi:hypothetical protein